MNVAGVATKDTPASHAGRAVHRVGAVAAGAGRGAGRIASCLRARLASTSASQNLHRASLASPRRPGPTSIAIHRPAPPPILHHRTRSAPCMARFTAVDVLLLLLAMVLPPLTGASPPLHSHVIPSRLVTDSGPVCCCRCSHAEARYLHRRYAA